MQPPRHTRIGDGHTNATSRFGNQRTPGGDAWPLPFPLAGNYMHQNWGRNL